MHISEKWKTSAGRIEQIIALGSTLVFVTWLAFFFFQTGHVPDFPPAFLGCLLAAVWIAAILKVIRYGKQGLTIEGSLLVVAYTMMVSPKLLPIDGDAAEAIRNDGYFLMAISILYWIFGRRLQKAK